MLKSNFDLVGEKFVGYCILVFKILENILESKPLKTSRKFPYFGKNQLCTLFNLSVYLSNLHRLKEQRP